MWQACVKANLSKCSASYLQQLKHGLLGWGYLVLVSLDLAAKYCWLVRYPGWFVSSLFVSMANLITARITCRLGAHFRSSDAAFPLKKKERFPIIVCPTRRMPVGLLNNTLTRLLTGCSLFLARSAIDVLVHWTNRQAVVRCRLLVRTARTSALADEDTQHITTAKTGAKPVVLAWTVISRM